MTLGKEEQNIFVFKNLKFYTLSIKQVVHRIKCIKYKYEIIFQSLFLGQLRLKYIRVKQLGWKSFQVGFYCRCPGFNKMWPHLSTCCARTHFWIWFCLLFLLGSWWGS